MVGLVQLIAKVEIGCLRECPGLVVKKSCTYLVYCYCEDAVQLVTFFRRMSKAILIA